jgi:hypothetical protein
MRKEAGTMCGPLLFSLPGQLLQKDHVLVYVNEKRNFRVVRNFFFAAVHLFALLFRPSEPLTAAPRGTLGLV